MKITEITRRNESLCLHLLNLWEGSVRVTHKFLNEKDIMEIYPQVREALLGVERLFVAWEGDTPVAFMGIQKDNLEMLFVGERHIGQGVGKQLLQKAMDDYGVIKLDVNEQNPSARGFYEHMGFEVSGRSENDDQGNPFPILHMILKKYHKIKKHT